MTNNNENYGSNPDHDNHFFFFLKKKEKEIKKDCVDQNCHRDQVCTGN